MEILSSFVHPHVIPNTSDEKKERDVRQSARLYKVREQEAASASKYINLAEHKNVDLLVLFYYICLQLTENKMDKVYASRFWLLI